MTIETPAPDADQEPAPGVGDTVGYSLYTEDGWVDLVAVDKVLRGEGKGTTLTAADLRYMEKRYGLTANQIRNLRWPGGSAKHVKGRTSR